MLPHVDEGEPQIPHHVVHDPRPKPRKMDMKRRGIEGGGPAVSSTGHGRGGCTAGTGEEVGGRIHRHVGSCSHKAMHVITHQTDSVRGAQAGNTQTVLALPWTSWLGIPSGGIKRYACADVRNKRGPNAPKLHHVANFLVALARVAARIDGIDASYFPDVVLRDEDEAHTDVKSMACLDGLVQLCE